MLGLIITLALAVVAYFYMRQIRQQGSPETDSGLENEQRVIVPLLILLNPIIHGLIFYLGWKKKLPRKAKVASNWAVGIILFLVIAGVSFGVYFVNQTEVSDDPEVQKSRTKAVLQGLRSESITYFSKNNDSYVGMCEKLTSLDVTTSGSRINPQEAFRNARCFAKEDVFAVSVTAGGTSYCIAKKTDQNLPGDIQSGMEASENPISCSEK
jgi:hypothetical protein